MAEYRIRFHGWATVEADSEDEARKAFFNDEEDHSEYTVDSIEEE